LRLKIEALANLLRYPQVYLLLGGLILLAGLSLSIGGAGIFGVWLRIIIGLLIFLLPGGFLFALSPCVIRGTSWISSSTASPFRSC